MQPLREPTAADYILLPIVTLLLPIIIAAVAYGIFVLGPRQYEDQKPRRADESTTVVVPHPKPGNPK
jgi:hypothetical protein